MGYPQVAISVRWRDNEAYGRCPTCGEWWALTPEFWQVNSGMRRCTACFREYHKLRMRGVRADEAHGALLRARQRMYYAAHREARRASSARWRAENPEKAKESRRRHYEKNRERELAKVRAYYDEARDVILMKKRARAKAA